MADLERAIGKPPAGPQAQYRLRTACVLAYIAGWVLLVVGEVIPAWPDLNAEGPLNWLLAGDVDLLISLALLLVAPVAWRLQTAERARLASRFSGPAERWQAWVTAVGEVARGSRVRAVGLSLLVAAASLGTSAWTGSHFDSLPPAYHDEYSYLFQAHPGAVPVFGDDGSASRARRRRRIAGPHCGDSRAGGRAAFR